MTDFIYQFGSFIGGAILRTGILGATLEGTCYLFGVNDECELCVKSHHYIIGSIVVIFVIFSAIVWDAKRYNLEKEIHPRRKRKTRK